MKILCTICMRGGSKGVPGKNIKMLNGKPLMEYTIQQAMDCELFDKIVISTDSDEILNIAKKMGLETWFKRPKSLSTDFVPKIPVIRNALLESEKYFKTKFEIIFDLDVTSPLRNISDIKNAFLQFKNEQADILITASKARKNPYFNMVESNDGKIELVKKLQKNIGARQEAPAVFDMNASIYIWRREILICSDSLFSEKTSLYPMPEERSFDIDTELDWSIVEFLIKKGT